MSSVLSLMVPAEILACFDFRELLEDNNSITIVMNEKTDLYPPFFKEKGVEAVLNGFCNPMEVQTFPQKGKSTFIKLHRRKWKQAGGRASYFNTYEFHAPEAKLTDPFAFFLKGAP